MIPEPRSGRPESIDQLIAAALRDAGIEHRRAVADLDASDGPGSDGNHRGTAHIRLAQAQARLDAVLEYASRRCAPLTVVALLGLLGSGGVGWWFGRSL